MESRENIDLKNLLACQSCGLIQQRPAQTANYLACARCAHRLAGGDVSRSPEYTAALALAALAVYIPAILMPIMTITQMGHSHHTSILMGAATLIAEGRIAIIIPLGKIAGLLALSTDVSLLRRPHRAWTWRLIEWTGKWSMLDVLLVAMLVVVMKLGDLVHVEPGPGLLLFAAFVILSLAASICFDQRAIWNRAT
jgi:paraquat-inducible protein A